MRSAVLPVLVAISFAAGAAFAQQGMLVERARPSAPAPLVPRVMPASGLDELGGQLAPAALQPRLPPLAPLAVSPRHKWTPPVVQLLVDPWAGQGPAAPALRAPWLPQTQEIIDPWASRVPVPVAVSAPAQAARPGRESIF